MPSSPQRDVGTPVSSGRYMHAKLPASTFANMADNVERFAFETREGPLLLVREPVGVVGCITPWNYPLHQIAAKVAPALAAGCTVVVKPSEVAPLIAWRLAELVEERRVAGGRLQHGERLRAASSARRSRATRRWTW